MAFNFFDRPVIRPFKRATYYGFCTALLVAIFSLALPNVYMSEVRILPGDNRSGGGNLAQLAAAAAAIGVAIPGTDSADSTFVDILNSRWMKEQLLTTRYRYSVQSWRFGNKTERESTLLEYLKAKNLDVGVRNVKNLLNVSTDLKSRLLTIQVITKSPELSKALSLRIVNLLEEFTLSRVRRRGSNKAKFVSERLRDASASLERLEADYQNFWNANRNYLQSSDPAIRIRGAHFEAELKLKQQVLAALTINYEQAIIEEKNDMPILNILDPSNLPIEKTGPSRWIYTLVSFFIVACGTALVEHRARLTALFLEESE